MFITFEGIDGSGKTTQAKLLAEAMQSEGLEVVLTREPGGTELGERIRQLLLAGPAISPWAEAALFAAARAELVEQVIAPALERGAHVICDRYLDSSLAYQGIARDLGVGEVLELNAKVIRGYMPDKTFLLLVDLGESAKRMGGNADRIERENDDFRMRVDKAYRELAGTFLERIVPVDGSKPPAKIAKVIHEQLRQRL